MTESLENLDRRIDALRAQVRQALQAQDRERARVLRGELRDAERAWHAVAEQEDRGGVVAWRPVPPDEHAVGSRETGQGHPRAGMPGPGPGAGRVLLPLREQVHQVLTLLTVPTAPRLISTVHEALFAGAIPGSRLTSLRRDEERSFRAAPFARPYYLCAALTADFLAPVRGLIAVSTWPMERRVIGSLSPRVDYLTAAIQIAESIQRLPKPGHAASRLLWRFAANIPGAAQGERLDAGVIVEAARTELAVHADADAATRRAAASRARQQLDDVQQLFGARLRNAPQARAGA